jgi:hypothetical protein
VISKTDTALWGYTVAASTSAGASITHESALKTREPSYVTRADKFFFIHVAHNLPGPWDTWQHRSSRLTKAEPRAVGHMSTPELPLRKAEPWDTWQRRSSNQQGGEVRGNRTRGDVGAHLSKEVRSGATGHVAVPVLTSARWRGPGPRNTWRFRRPPLQEVVIRSYNIRGSAWMHALLHVLT